MLVLYSWKSGPRSINLYSHFTQIKNIMGKVKPSPLFETQKSDLESKSTIMAAVTETVAVSWMLNVTDVNKM